MAQVNVTTTHTSDDLWLAIDNQDINLDQGQAEVELNPGRYLLYWWMTGAPGSKIEIVLTEGGQTVKHVTDSVPSRDVRGGGAGPFVVS